ncbi:hypothetical protein F511_39316 [Dorcoceras hygrometricum]|uniref:Uncharacterized protein n=1 Tax=Dorcoceras hygrometricum TaxID=472368 RepID=A0A2Z7BQ24_9LAMI|nr:hypothetical protein F511_39316 [Dorcoceras hygrometricum]
MTYATRDAMHVRVMRATRSTVMANQDALRPPTTTYPGHNKLRGTRATRWILNALPHEYDAQTTPREYNSKSKHRNAIAGKRSQGSI